MSCVKEEEQLRPVRSWKRRSSCGRPRAWRRNSCGLPEAWRRSSGGRRGRAVVGRLPSPSQIEQRRTDFRGIRCLHLSKPRPRRQHLHLCPCGSRSARRRSRGRCSSPSSSCAAEVDPNLLLSERWLVEEKMQWWREEEEMRRSSRGIGASYGGGKQGPAILLFFLPSCRSADRLPSPSPREDVARAQMEIHPETDDKDVRWSKTTT